MFAKINKEINLMEESSVIYNCILVQQSNIWPLVMDLIHNDVIIDKMAALVGGLCHVLIRSNQNALLETFFAAFTTWNHEGIRG